MLHTRFSSILCKTAFFAVLAATTACQTMNDAYTGATSAFDSDQPANKVEVKSPAAAPVQDVKIGEINPAEKPVELGSMSDKSLAVPPQAAAEPPPVLTPAAEAVAAPVVTTPAPAAPVASNTVPLLTIRFNQPHVYYEQALDQAVSAAEKTKSGVLYEVLSTVPDLTSLSADQQAKLTARAKDNLRNVVVKMQQQGVAPDRIRIAEQTLKIRSQEIRVFVR